MFLHQMVLVVHDVIVTSNGRSVWTTVAKWKAFTIGRDGPSYYRGKMTVNRQICIVGCLQFVERKQLCT
jgi:hypothetical protein